MQHTDIAIVGGGLAGSLTAAMLGRAGINVALIDPHEVYPPDFRCEKLDGSQIAILRKTGLAAAVLDAASADDEIVTARGGRIIDRRPHNQCGILYDNLVNTVRREIPANVGVIAGKVTAVENTPKRQTLTLATGETLSARLVILATGLNIGLRHMLGVEREILSAAHSVSVGFDVRPADQPRFPFRALTCYPQSVSDRMAYMSLFPIQSGTRGNLFLYRDMSDPLLRALRNEPREALLSLIPELERVTGRIQIDGFVKIRPVDLCRMRNPLRDGVVLIGDAFATSCPAAGTGTNKVLTDVERLCNLYIPRWLAEAGMSAGKIKEFYDDPAKIETDAQSEAKAFFLRSLSIDTGLIWEVRRQTRRIGHAVVGTLRRARRTMAHGNERRAGEAPTAPAPFVTASPSLDVAATPASSLAGMPDLGTPQMQAPLREEARS
jgi:2-polyprenyl-6-methoxyphenol hydroxylase-like FAD-dependent oxidoreductase